MFNVQRSKARIVAAIVFVLRQCERSAVIERPHAPGALESLHFRLECGERKVGAKLRGGTAFERIGAAAFESLHHRYFALVECPARLRGRRVQRLVVPTAAAGRIRLHLAVRAEHLHVIVQFRGVSAMKANGRLRAIGRLRLAVEQHEGMAAMRGVVACHCRLIVFESPGGIFLREQSDDEVEIALALLRDTAVYAQRLGKFTAPVGDVVATRRIP